MNPSKPMAFLEESACSDWASFSKAGAEASPPPLCHGHLRQRVRRQQSIHNLSVAPKDLLLRLACFALPG